MKDYREIVVGDIIQVKITSINEGLGVFARMPNGHDGLIRLADFAWSNQINIIKSYSVGDILDVKVIKELPDGKLNLSRKELLPNPKTLTPDTILQGVVKKVEKFGLIVKIGDFSVLVLRKELPSPLYYSEGDPLFVVIKECTYNQEKHRYDILASVLALHEYFAQDFKNGAIIKCNFIERKKTEDYNIYAIISINDRMLINVPYQCFIEPYQSELLNNELPMGCELEFMLNYKEKTRTISLDMRPIKKARIIENEAWLWSQLHVGDIVEAEVIDLNDREARVVITNTEVEYILPREELSPNKVVRAGDEVFIGEHIHIAYLGNEDGRLHFSRRFVVKDKYDESLYDLQLSQLLQTMGLTTNKFAGKLIKIKSDYFLKNLITTGEPDEKNNGKLLIDPVNGKNLIAIIDNKLRNFFSESCYYEVELNLASKEYRFKQGTPYMFCVTSNNIKEVTDPYKESVSLSFKQHTSPNTNTSVANLLEEVGKSLYSSKKRMFFELLQNADDAASTNGVKVKVQIAGKYLVLTHDGYSFNKDDFESITSAAKSTKRANDKKTGYKGIGFKSVFTNSHSVLIKSSGYTFAFDKECPIYDSFEGFYHLVNDIIDDKAKQEEFNHKYAKFKREFNGVKDIPWQLLPVWKEGAKLEIVDSIFNKNENVAIALKMDDDTLVDYGNAVKEVFEEPRFMLFLRKTNRVQLIQGKECLTIQKNRSEDGKFISLVNSFDKKNRVEDYSIFRLDSIPVNDQEFKNAGIAIRRDERINNRGESESYFVRTDSEGNIVGEVTGIPDRIASTIDTTLSFAIKRDEYGHIQPLGSDTLSLYAYLPMNEHRFKFPFFINADFIPKSDREGIQSDNPWNHFVFYTIGNAIVRMVASYASFDEPEYLNLLPTKFFQSSSHDTAALVDAFNRGYDTALKTERFIVNDVNDIVSASEIIYDDSGLSEIIGNPAFYTLLNTNKHLPHRLLKSNCLARALFQIDKFDVDSICKILSSDVDSLSQWLITCTDDIRNGFYQWLASNEAAHSLVYRIPTFLFGTNWRSISQISLDNKEIILTDKILPMVDVLCKLGFCISENQLNEHPLSSFLNTQDEKDIFKKIQECSISNLSYNDRLTLFENCLEFDGVGKEMLKKWAIFKNQNGDYTPLGQMSVNNENCPIWLYPFTLNKSEYNQMLSAYLIPSSDVYSSVVELNIETITESVDLLEVYIHFRGEWNNSFTETLFRKSNISKQSLLTIVEQSDNRTKANYVHTIKDISLISSEQYPETSFTYRLIKLAAQDDSTITYVRSIITIDEKKLSDYTLKDEFTLEINDKRVGFSLSQLLPSLSSTSALSSIVSNFTSIHRCDEIFAQTEVSPKYVYDQLNKLLKESSSLISEDQFCFLMVYHKSLGYSIFANSLRPHIRVNDESLFVRILDNCFRRGLGEILGSFVRDGGVLYPFPNLIGSYFDSEEYTLNSERTPNKILTWANSNEKKQFLIQIGLHDNQSKEIIRRKSFKDKKFESIWGITNPSIINSFMNWVAASFYLPIQDENQVKVLYTLFKSLNIARQYNEIDFLEAKEWTNSLYLDWKKGTDLKISIIEGALPYRGVYNNTYLFKDYFGEYIYIATSKTIYISSNREPAVILADLYSNSSRLNCPFTKNDWDKIFLVSADVVMQKDMRIAELERELEQARNVSSREYLGDEECYGNVLERGSVDKERRIELNVEARIAAKEFLDALSDFDCSQWDPSEGNGLIKDAIKYKNEFITVVVTSSIGRKLYLHPRLFAELMTNKNNRLLNYGYDRKIHPINFDETFKDNKDVNLIFDADIVTPEEFAHLANRYMHSKRTCFVIENIRYSASEQIKGFGLDEKKEDAEVYNNLSFDDIFDF
ncbi:S1 RNA-binding domain-containing protein [Tannerella forsythia]|uniref:S1 RNA-binding domain-containing protein n=1 Tax=Tannerella forsythia TaxID=28112 RepID=A0A3P1Z5Z2_TANFO|nr:S1 RNA-binding domain-containing protein [Tannerella forsythia]RRD78288.1 S1 RNA-binding domain-containing protein [Tannerella forsythia]